MKQNYVTLNDGNRIPQFGLGVYLIRGDEPTREVCLAAVQESGIPREEIWITSKLWPSEYGDGKTMEGIDKMLNRLDTDYIDLLLLHQQFGDYLGA